MRGRRPIPAALKAIRGNPGKRPLRDGVEAPAGVPKPPRNLTPPARAIWRKLAPDLATMGVLSRVDAGLFGVYCQALATYHKANAQLALEGEVVKAPSGYPIQNPWLAIRNAASKEMGRIAPEFGLTAAARERIHVERPDAMGKNNPFDEFDHYFGPGLGKRA